MKYVRCSGSEGDVIVAAQIGDVPSVITAKSALLLFSLG